MDGREGIWRWSPSGPTLTCVAVSGQSSGIGGTTFSYFSRNPSINNSGHVAFATTLSSGSAILRWDGSTFTTISLDTQNATSSTGTSLGVTFGSLKGSYDYQPVFLSATDDVLFEHVNISNGLYGWWLGNGSSLKGLAYAGAAGWTQYPNPGGSGPMISVAGADINASGVAAVVVHYADNGGGPLSAVFRGTPGSLTLVRQTNDAAPSSPTSVSGVWTAITGSSMNNSGEIACRTEFDIGTDRLKSISLLNSYVALGNSAAPGTGSPGDNFLSSGSAWYLNAASVNNAGRTLFSAATDAATSPISSGIWHGVPGSLKLFAYDFHSIPCEHSAGTYIDIAGWDLVQCINDAGDDGQFVAMAEFNDGTSQRTGIFAGDARFNRQYVVAAVGDSVVDQNSTSYGSALSVGLGQLGISETVGHGLRTTPYNGYCTISACGVIPLWVQLSGGQAIFSRHLLPADVNGDHLININDYVAFGIAAATPDTCAADFDGDGLITVNDYVLFGNAYSVSAASCP